MLADGILYRQLRDWYTVPDGKFGRILHDWELEEFGHKPRQLQPGYGGRPEDDPIRYPVPSTRMLECRYQNKHHTYIPFPLDWQYWLYDMLAKAIGLPVPSSDLLFAYTDLIANHRAFTDTRAPENGYCDYVTGRNMGKKPYEWKTLSTSGNIVKILGGSGEYYIVEALDLLQLPPSDYPSHLIHWATQSTIDPLPRKDGTRRWIVSRFPQIKVACRKNNIPENGTPFPLVSFGGTLRIAKKYVEIVTGEHSPYVLK